MVSGAYLGVHVACGPRSATACSGRVFLENKPAPAAVARALETAEGEVGDVVDLSILRGKPAVVNFWASWCGPCREEAPVLREMWEQLSDTVEFVGVDIRDEQAAAKSFVEEFNLRYLHLFDKDARIAAAWGVSSPPTTFVVDANGRLVGRFVGTLTRNDLECMVGLVS